MVHATIMTQHDGILSRKRTKNGPRVQDVSRTTSAIGHAVNPKLKPKRWLPWFVVAAVVVVAVTMRRGDHESSFSSSSFLRLDDETWPKQSSSKRERVSKTEPSFSSGCKVCDAPNVFSFGQALEDASSNAGNNQTAELVCQCFWHKKYPSWEACRQAAREIRIQFRSKLCQLCRTFRDTTAPATTATPSLGVVYAISGTKLIYFHQAKRGIQVLRSHHLQYNGTIQVFVDSEQGKQQCESIINKDSFLNIDCRLLSRSFKVGYNAKLAAAIETDLDNVILIDTDNVLIRHPHKILQSTKMLHGDHSIILFPDFWGHDCQRFTWAKDVNNPSGIMLAGQSAWQSHVIWPTMDIEWQPYRPFSQEIGNTITVIQKEDKGVHAAYELAFWMTEQPFFQKVLFGEKDTIRLALLALNVPFIIVEDMPNELVSGEKLARHHMMAVLDGTPITFDLVKGPISNCCVKNADLIVKVAMNVTATNRYNQNEAGSFCIHSGYGGPNRNHLDPRLEIHNTTQDPIARQWLDRLYAMDKENGGIEG
jgi:hypothetical protein